MNADRIAALEAENRQLRAQFQQAAALEALPALLAALRMKGAGRPDIIEDAARLASAIIERRPAEASLAQYRLQTLLERRVNPAYLEARHQLETHREDEPTKPLSLRTGQAVGIREQAEQLLAELEAQSRAH